MTTLIKTKFKISDDQTNMNKYRLAANITEYHIISKLNNIGFGILIEFPNQREKKIFKSVHKQGNWTFVVQRVI